MVLLLCTSGQSMITDVIDFDQSADNMMVHYGVCTQLDQIKETYYSLPDKLTEVSCAGFELPDVKDPSCHQTSMGTL